MLCWSYTYQSLGTKSSQKGGIILIIFQPIVWYMERSIDSEFVTFDFFFFFQETFGIGSGRLQVNILFVLCMGIFPLSGKPTYSLCRVYFWNMALDWRKCACPNASNDGVRNLNHSNKRPGQPIVWKNWHIYGQHNPTDIRSGASYSKTHNGCGGKKSVYVDHCNQ